MLTAFQNRKLTQLFHLLDNDSSGFLDSTDLDRVAQNLAGAIGAAPGSRPYATLQARYGGMWRAVASSDSDGDGRVTLREWLKAADDMMSSPAKYDEVVGQLVDQVFDLIDADRDGRVSLTEYASWLGASNVTAEVAAAAFRKIDLNSDGIISKDELTYAFLDFYYSDDPKAPGNGLFGGLI